MQKGMLFHDLSSPEHQPYFRQVSFRIEGHMDPELCERTWNELMARHESLRSCFDYENTSQPLRLVWKQRSIEFGYHDLAGADESARTAGLNGYCDQDRKRGFDLRRDPLMRVKLFKLGDARFEMVWSWPHIILDGWSGSVLLDEFTRVYSDLSERCVPSLPPAPPLGPYMDWLAARDMGAARRYWAELLAGYESLATIPKRSDGLNRQGYDPAEHAFALSDSQSAALGELAARNGVSTATVMHSLWGILLGRYNDTDDVVFGSVVSGRPPEVAGVERMVGLFLNTIPVRVRMESAANFAGLLQDVQRTGMENVRHDHLQLAEVQAESAMTRGLFDHVLVFENYPDAATAGEAEFVVTSVETREHVNYDFGVLVLPGTPFRIQFNYNGCAYSAGQMRRLEMHFRTLLDQVLRNDRVPLDDLDILTPSEQTVAMGPRVPCPSTTLAGLWEAQVARTPDNIALSFDDRSWSYREVNERANQVAHMLRTRLALQVEDRIGVLMERGEWRVIALLGILKAGGAYFPISSTCPDERLRFLLDDSGCRAVIGDAAGVRRVNAVRDGIGADVEECRTGPVHNPPPVCGAANLAYLIHTSGSTGRPKGVLIEHGGFVNMILDQIRSFGVTPADRVLQFASSSFDASLSEIFMALAAGARLVLIGEETRRDANLFQACMLERRISVITLPPCYLRAFEQPEFPYLRVLITAGEPADAADVRHYSTRLRYFNAYGPTEASVCASFHEVRPQDIGLAEIPIGRPVSNSCIWLLDRRLRPVPMDVPGEICIQGPGLARGYLNRPELTRSQFVRAPSCGGARLYRTGDLGCLREDGQIVCLGRADTQVKFHGFRIELGEIESVVREYPGIGQAAVSLGPTPMDAGKLVAYYVAESPLDPGKLRDHLSRRLPPYMVPSALIPVRAIPRTTAGKVDRAALAAVAQPSGCGPAGPVNDVQRTIASVFQEVLGRDDIGIHDSFLDLGGDSLKAILAVGRLRRRGLNLDLRDLSSLGSIARLAVACSECRPASADATGPAPLTPIQHWFFSEHSRAQWHCLSHAILLRAAGGIEEGPLRAAVAALWQHHDALRMRFRVEDSGAVTQAIGPATAGACFETLDLRLESDAWGRLATRANALHAGFSLDTGPLFKVALCRMPDGDHALLVAHHLVVDGVSWRILLEDFSDAYQQARKGDAISLPSKTSSYADWANALTAWSRSESLLREKAYWSAVESGRTDPLPTDFPVTPHHYGETDVLTLNIPAPLSGGDTDSGIQAVLLTAVARTLHQWTGCESTRVLLAGHGRIPLTDVDVSRTIGWFTANYPVLVSTTDAADVAGQVEATRRMLASVPAQGVGFGVLKYVTPARVKTDLIQGGEPEIGLNYLGRIDAKPAGAFALSDRLPSASAGMLERAHKLEFDAMLTEAGLVVSVRYCPKLHRTTTISEICRRLYEELALAWPAASASSSDRLELQEK